ncbi:hypothetical protein DNTS_021947 [Danionella cerebrum]|nr:hypothetical protein DNTS_021947 [Danionella translucida]
MVLKITSYVLIGVGSFSMLLGFLGCLGAIYEIRCLLGLYFACLLLILLAQVAVAILIYFQRDLLRKEAETIVSQVIANYPGQNKTAEQAWDYLQRSMQCCGWNGLSDWERNNVIQNASVELYPCSCHNVSLSPLVADSGFCQASSNDWPIYQMLLGMILSMGLCKSVHQEDYTKVPKY